MPKTPKQLLLAHRGYSAIAPENTELAFDCALSFGFDGVELDVHQTADHELVIIHDETTNRTAQSKHLIGKTRLEQLQTDDHAIFFKIGVPPQKILTLKEFLDKYLKQIKCLNIEIKTDVTHYVGIEKNLHNLVSQYANAHEKIIFSSFNFESLEIMHKLSPKYRLGFLWWTKTQFKKVNRDRIQAICEFLHPWTKIYDKYRNEYLKLGLKFNLWTIKAKTVYQKYLKDEFVYSQISNYKF